MKIIHILTSGNHILGGGVFKSFVERESYFDSINFSHEYYALVYIETALFRFFKKILNKNLSLNSKIENYPLTHNDLVYIQFKHSVWMFLFRYVFPKLYHYYVYRIVKNKIDFHNSSLIGIHFCDPTALVALKLYKNFGISYFLFFHGSDLHSAGDHLYKKNLKAILDNASFIYFVGNELFKYAGSIIDVQTKSLVTYNGFDRNVFYLQAGESNEDHIYGFVGNLYIVKGADRIMNIFEEIKRIDDNAKFVVIGEGGLFTNIRNQSKIKGLPIEFTGNISPNSVSKWMNRMSSLIIPSRKEGVPLVINEAKACGVFVVATDVGSIPEIIGVHSKIVNYEIDGPKGMAKIAISGANEYINSRTQIASEAYKYQWKGICKLENQFFWKRTRKLSQHKYN